jgi:D-alanyl-D-alanine carboxypeptidase/D-alanyl-D-alanine-endopeptidase (penicillin-binding protein 4)
MNLSARAPLLAAAAAVALAAGTAADPLAAQTATSAEETIRAAVDAITGTPPLHRTHWGIEVYDPVDDRILVERNPHHLFVPASNTKVVTVVAALGLLGPDWRYVTAIEAAGVQDGVASSLVVRGSGDPTLSSHFHDDPLAPLDSLADSLAAAGIRRIEGPVIVDQSRFDSVLTHPAWERFDLDWYYAAPVAPFAVMEGAYEVVIRPGSAGAPATVELPRVDGLVGVDAAVITADGAGRWDDQLRRIPGADSVVLRGSVGTDIDADTSWIAQDDPGRLAGRALVRALEGAGIAVLGGVEVRYGGAPAAGTDGATEAVVRVGWRSPPLRDIVPLSLERSDNWLSEQIVRTLGAELGEVGSWSEGTRIVEE